MNTNLEPSGENGSTFTTIGEYIARKFGTYPEHDVACPGCSNSYNPVAIVKLDRRWRCGHCKIQEEREVQIANDREFDPASCSWDSEFGNGIKAERNALLERWSWTIRLDSPLTAECQALFVAYMKALNRLTVKYERPALALFPELPVLEYEDEGTD